MQLGHTVIGHPFSSWGLKKKMIHNWRVKTVGVCHTPCADRSYCLSSGLVNCSRHCPALRWACPMLLYACYRFDWVWDVCVQIVGFVDVFMPSCNMLAAAVPSKVQCIFKCRRTLAPGLRWCTIRRAQLVHRDGYFPCFGPAQMSVEPPADCNSLHSATHRICVVSGILLGLLWLPTPSKRPTHEGHSACCNMHAVF